MNNLMFLKKSVVIIFLTLGMLSGCNMLQDRDRMMRFDDGLKEYSAALRWGREKTAIQYLRQRVDGGIHIPENISFKPDISVTEFKVREIAFSNDKMEAVVTSRMSYFAQDSGVVRVVNVQQLWWYDEKAGFWFIDGTLPKAILNTKIEKLNKS